MELPKSIRDIKELKDLDLSDNNLKSLPEEIGKLTQLYQFTIYGNNALTDLPDSLVNCFHITILNVSGTQIANARKLEFLDRWDALKKEAKTSTDSQ